MFRLLLLASFLTASSLVVSLHPEKRDDGLPVRLLYEYPVGTWVENIVVRPSGELLMTLINTPHIDQLNQFDPDPVPTTVSVVPNGTAVFGIAEIDNDVYAFAHGGFSLTAGATPGSWSVWTATFPQPHEPTAAIAKVADVSDARFINGLTNLPSTSKPERVLAADIQTGKVYRVEIKTGEWDVPISNDLTAPAPDPVFGTVGTNGLHVRDSTLYFANTGQDILARLPITESGDPAGPPSVIAHALPETEYDDFALRGEYAYMVTGYGDSIERVSLDGKSRDRIIAGVLNTTTFAEPTSVAFGRTEKDRDVLYVVTAGGLAAPVKGNITVGAQVLAIDLGKCGW